MNTTPDFFPDLLVQQWTPWLRGVAFKTGVSFDDVRQEAWLLAATMPLPDGADDAEDLARRRKWQAAVAKQVKKQAVGKIVYADPDKPAAGFLGTGWLTEATTGTTGDRAGFLAALENIAEMHTDQQLADALGIGLPETTAEIAQALGVCERQARRIKNKINELKAVQRDLFADLFVGDESEVPGEVPA